MTEKFWHNQKILTEKKVIVVFDFLASSGAPGGPRSKNNENYFDIFLRQKKNTESGKPESRGCRDPGFRNLEWDDLVASIETPRSGRAVSLLSILFRYHTDTMSI